MKGTETTHRVESANADPKWICKFVPLGSWRGFHQNSCRFKSKFGMNAGMLAYPRQNAVPYRPLTQQQQTGALDSVVTALLACSMSANTSRRRLCSRSITASCK
ncbi:hypothetical protein OH492_14015 [Vibrio chagasii]|nr:hypothetical protein [Vibrio chagasii]